MTIRESIQQLAKAQKSSRGVSFYSRLINRPLGRVLAAVCHSAGLSPNQVTVLSAVVTALGLASLVLLPAREVAGPVGALLLILGFALDSADGQLARLRGSSSPLGEWLDHVVDAGKMVAVHGAVLLAMYLHSEVSAAWLLVPLGFQLVAVLIYAGGTLLPLIVRARTSSDPMAARPSTIRSLALLPADYGVLCFVLALVAVPTVFAWAYPALFALNVVIMVLLVRRWCRVLSGPS